MCKCACTGLELHGGISRQLHVHVYMYTNPAYQSNCIGLTNRFRTCQDSCYYMYMYIVYRSSAWQRRAYMYAKT